MKRYEVEEHVYVDAELRDLGISVAWTSEVTISADSAKEAARRIAERFLKKTGADYGVDERAYLYARCIARGYGQYAEYCADLEPDKKKKVSEDALRSMSVGQMARA